MEEVTECVCRSLDIQEHDCDELFSLPSARNLVSAMKGGRGREGGPRKLSVSWAPEVYDPIPTSMSHTLTNRNSSKNKKKNKNNKHKDKDRDKAKKKKNKKKSVML